MINEIELIRLYKENPKDEYIDLILEAYKPLVNKLSRRLCLLEIDLDDAIQEGMIGLFNAVLSFDEKKEVLFYTFAKKCIENRLTSFVRKSLSNKNKLLTQAITGYDNEIIDNICIGDEVDPENLYIQDENYENLLKSITKELSPLENNILMQYLDGKNIEDIRKKLNIEKKIIYNAIYRIRKKLSHIDNK